MASTAPPRFPQLPDPSAREGKLKIFIPDGVVVHTILACMYRKEEKKKERKSPVIPPCMCVFLFPSLQPFFLVSWNTPSHKILETLVCDPAVCERLAALGSWIESGGCNGNQGGRVSQNIKWNCRYYVLAALGQTLRAGTALSDEAMRGVRQRTGRA